MADFKNYYIDKITDCVLDNKVEEFNLDGLSKMDEDELIAAWDTLRWSHGDLSRKEI